MPANPPVNSPVNSLGAEAELSCRGAGPHPRPWPEDGRLDQDLLRHGDSRNVEDRYRYWHMQAIIDDLDRRRHPYQVAVENWQHDMNIGSIVRSANAFGAAAVHIVGQRRWNRRGAMVTDRYQHVEYQATVEDLMLHAQRQGLCLVGVDNVPGSIPLESYRLPERCLLLFGQEGPGLSEAALAGCSALLGITQFGSTRSINAAAAAAIVMHTWICQHIFKQ